LPRATGETAGIVYYPRFAIGSVPTVLVVVGIGAGYFFDYLLEKYRKESCTCESTNFGARGNAATAGAIGATGLFGSKPRTEIAGCAQIPSGNARIDLGDAAR
jgi:hypothetical protein